MQQPPPFLACALFLATASVAFSATAYPPRFEGARTEVYKEIGDLKLKLYIFEPAGPMKTNRPAIVFFFGGGWASGTPAQFEPQCRRLAARGMVAITADYRVASRHQVKPTACVADAKSAVRWLRRHAARLGLDPHRLAAGGGSAGGHLAAAIATVPGFDEPGEDTTVSAVPDALVLFNPVLVLAPLDGLELKGFGSTGGSERFGTEPRNLSPAHHVKPGTPPTIIFHGRADTTVPFATAEAFTRLMQAAGNRCELVAFDGQQHGFFNYGRGDGKAYRETLAGADQFLVSLGYLEAARGPRLGTSAMFSRRPNVLFILADDQRWDTFHALGNPEVQTPNLDRLAALPAQVERVAVLTQELEETLHALDDPARLTLPGFGLAPLPAAAP